MLICDTPASQLFIVANKIYRTVNNRWRSTDAFASGHQVHFSAEGELLRWLASSECAPRSADRVSNQQHAFPFTSPPMKNSTPDNLASNVTPPKDDCLTIGHSPAGEIELPEWVYRLIEPDLPQCLQCAEDDCSSLPHLAGRFLQTQSNGWVTLRTRNLLLVGMLLMKHRVKFRLYSRIESVDCFRRVPFGPPGGSEQETVPSPIQKLGEFVDGNLAGMIVTQNQHQTFDAVAALCVMFPKVPIALLVASDAEANLTASEVGKRVQAPIGLAHGYEAVFPLRITVLTFSAWCSPYVWGVPFLIAPIWKAGYPLWLKQAPQNPYLDRAYLFRTVNQPLTEREADGIEGRLGPSFSLVTGKYCWSHQPRYFLTYEFGGAGSHQRNRTPSRTVRGFDRQKLYWRHRRRNQALAALAQNLSETNGTLAVLTENVAHAEAFSRLLRDWALVKQGAVPAIMPDRFIVTVTAASRWQNFRPGTVVVASGGFHSPWLLDWGEEMCRSGSSVRLVDLTDGFDETASRLAAGRLDAYREAGWHWRPLANSVVRAVGRSLRLAQNVNKSV